MEGRYEEEEEEEEDDGDGDYESGMLIEIHS